MAPIASVRRLSKAGSDPRTPMKAKRSRAVPQGASPKKRRLLQAKHDKEVSDKKSAQPDAAPSVEETELVSMEEYQRKISSMAKFCCENRGKWFEIRLSLEAFREILQPFAVGLLPFEFDSNTSVVMGSLREQEQLREFCGVEGVPVKEMTFTFMPAEGKLSMHTSAK